MNNDTIWRNCTNEELLETLASCPKVIEAMKRIGYNEMINSFDALLPIYKMDRGTSPVYKENSEEVDHFEYWIFLDGVKIDMAPDESYATKYEAQLASVKSIMFEVEKRIAGN